MKKSNSAATFSPSEEFPRDPRNLYSNTDYSKEAEEENKSELEFLENLEEFAGQFEVKDFDSANPNISEKSKMILGALPKKTQEYVEEIKKIKKEAAEEIVDEKDPEKLRKLIERRLENQQRAQKIAQELFIISCASNKPLKTSMQFHAQCNLGIKEFKDFGENGLSPLAATMISGKVREEGQPSKAEEYLNKMKEKGLDEKEVMNVKSPSGMTAMDIAVLTGNAEMAKLLSEKGGELGLLKGPKQQTKQGVTTEEASAELDERAARFNNRKRVRGNSGEGKEGNSETSEAEEKKGDDQKSAQEALRAREVAESQIAIQLSEERIEKEAKKQRKADAITESKESEEYYAQKAKSKLEQESSEKLAREKSEVAGKMQSSNVELAKILGISVGGSEAEITLDKLLFHAVDQNKNNLAKIILSLGGNPNHQENGVSVLSRAVERGDESLVSRLYASASPETRKISEVACGENPKMREVLSNLSRSESSLMCDEKRGDTTVSSSSIDYSVPKIPQVYEELKMESGLVKVVEVNSKLLPPTSRTQSPIHAESLANFRDLQVGGQKT